MVEAYSITEDDLSDLRAHRDQHASKGNTEPHTKVGPSDCHALQHLHAEGYSYQLLANRTGLGRRTVKHHVRARCKHNQTSERSESIPRVDQTDE